MPVQREAGTGRVAAALEDVLPVLGRHAETVDHDRAFPTQGVDALRRSGLMGLLVPRQYGGMGGGLGELVAVAQQLAGQCSSTALIWVMHSQQVDALTRFASPALCRRVLPGVVGGRYLASVTTEDSIGGHLLTASSPMVERANEVEFDRAAPVVTGGAHADAYMVKLRTSPSADATDTTLLYAERDQVEIELHGAADTLGMRGSENVALSLRGQVPRSQIVGAPGCFRDIAVDSFTPTAHLGWSACWLGACRAAFAQLVRHLRRDTSVDLRSDLLLHQIARIRSRLDVVSAYLHTVLDEVALLRSQGRRLDDTATQIHINTVKVLAAEETYQAANDMVTLAGMRIGYVRGSPVPLERLLRDLRSAELNYHDHRLLHANGTLSLMDGSAQLAGETAVDRGRR